MLLPLVKNTKKLTKYNFFTRFITGITILRQTKKER
jgi:hypothetical protein